MKTQIGGRGVRIRPFYLQFSISAIFMINK